ncbi:MAG TPA: hypothetical protein VMS09_05750 [Paenibacillus sp.]|uniref:hypothetical protein n=1 Tax=Paenibacillus sp. TaxID=58172 RepID=UPI002C2337B7|nr:hypothetical protein [Paenibacillus sp.]HUC91523.1 hypothetical protein [Paenibacillus sp.]
MLDSIQRKLIGHPLLPFYIGFSAAEFKLMGAWEDNAADFLGRFPGIVAVAGKGDVILLDEMQPVRQNRTKQYRINCDEERCPAVRAFDFVMYGL